MKGKFLRKALSVAMAFMLVTGSVPFESLKGISGDALIEAKADGDPV